MRFVYNKALCTVRDKAFREVQCKLRPEGCKRCKYGIITPPGGEPLLDQKGQLIKKAELLFWAKAHNIV